MGIILRSNVDASAYASKAITAVTRSLAGMWFFDTSLDKAANDFGLASNVNSKAVGAPTVKSDCTAFSALTNYMQTDFAAEPDSFTFAMVIRSLYTNAEMQADVTKRCSGFSNFSAASSGGIVLGYAHPSDGRLSFGRATTFAGATALQRTGLLSSIDPRVWQLVYGTFNAATGFLSVTAATYGSVSTCAGPGHVPHKSATTMRIGGAYGTNQAGPVEMSQLRFYTDVLNTEEIGAVLTEMRRYELTHNNRTV